MEEAAEVPAAEVLPDTGKLPKGREGEDGVSPAEEAMDSSQG